MPAIAGTDQATALALEIEAIAPVTRSVRLSLDLALVNGVRVRCWWADVRVQRRKGSKTLEAHASTPEAAIAALKATVATYIAAHGAGPALRSLRPAPPFATNRDRSRSN